MPYTIYSNDVGTKSVFPKYPSSIGAKEKHSVTFTHKHTHAQTHIHTLVIITILSHAENKNQKRTERLGVGIRRNKISKVKLSMEWI